MNTPLGLGLTATECSNIFAAGDMEYYRAAGCANTASNDALLSATKSKLNVKTVALVGGGLLLTGLVIYLSVKK